MDRELLLEIGCEEIPASWLPGLTTQLGAQLDASLKELRLLPEAPIETFSTPRRLTARIAKLAERQTDLEELVTGPPVSAAVGKDGAASPAAAGFAKKYGVDVAALERVETPKGVYLAHRVHQRGRATADVLADVMTGVLRHMTFPKQMRWDAYLEDGKGPLPFARPIRWLILTYGGRVVPFVDPPLGAGPGPHGARRAVGSNTYGHRFLTTSGRAGRAIKVKTFDDYRARLLENFVILERTERESRIRRELETHARKLGARLSGLVSAHSSLLAEVPDLVEYPSVVAGHFPPEFLQLPEEVLTTTMIHHQHYFPVVGEDGALKPAFLAVMNMQPEKPEMIARNAERVLTARLRDARFFYDADRQAPLESRVDRLATVLFHKKLGSYKEKAERVSRLAAWIAGEALGRPDAAAAAERAGRLCKADLATDMVRELTELQGTMGGIYARAEGMGEEIWKAIYYHYLPVGVEADAAPSKSQLARQPWCGRPSRWPTASTRWRACMRPASGPLDRATRWGCAGTPRAAVKILADLPELTGVDRRVPLGPLLEKAGAPFEGYRDAAPNVRAFVSDRLAYLLEQRGFDVRSIRAVTHGDAQRAEPARGAPEAGGAAADGRLRRAPGRGHPVQAREEHLEGRGGSGRPAGGRRPARRAGRSGAPRCAGGARAGDTTGGRRGRLSAGVRHSGVAGTRGRAILRRCDGDDRGRRRFGRHACNWSPTCRDLILGIADLSEMAGE